MELRWQAVEQHLAAHLATHVATHQAAHQAAHPTQHQAFDHVSAHATSPVQPLIPDPVCAYIYDLPALTQHVQQVVASLPPRCEMYYAIKANSDLPILQTMAPAGGRV